MEDETAAKVLDCAFTERAKKKLKRQKKSVRRRGETERDGEEAQGSLPPPRERGVIYLGHIPYGFFEEEMRNYFSQFGTVTRLKLYRSRKVMAAAPAITPIYFSRLFNPSFSPL